MKLLSTYDVQHLMVDNGKMFMLTETVNMAGSVGPARTHAQADHIRMVKVSRRG